MIRQLESMQDVTSDLEDLCLIADGEPNTFPLICYSTQRIVFVSEQCRNELVACGVRSVNLSERIE